MKFPDRHTVNVVLTIVLVAIGLAIVYIARAIIVIFAFSILFAYLINPLVRYLQRHSLFFKNLRGPHVAEAYIVFLIFIALVGHGLAPAFRVHTQKLLQLPALMESLTAGESSPEMSGGGQKGSPSKALWLKSYLGKHRSDIQNLTEDVERFTYAAIGGLVAIPILAIFFLSDGERLSNGLIRLVSTNDTHETICSLAAELNVMMQHYIRAKVTLGALSFAYCSAAMLILRFPNAIALGLLAGILEFIPVAGWIISAATIVSLGVLTHSHWIWMAALLGIWRMLMDYWIAPRVMGHELELHPLMAIFTMMVGGAIGGIVGVYLSMPLVAALRVVGRRLGRSNVQPEVPPAKTAAQVVS